MVPFVITVPQRTAITYFLCLLVAIGWLIAVALSFSVALGLLFHILEPMKFILASALFGVPLLLLGVVAGYALLMRRCDRCREPLFPFVTLRKPTDYRAKPLLFSYQRGAVLNTLVSGRSRCLWCGHLDGDRPDYVVTAPLRG